ncbi:MAG: hypothetical protein ACREJT_05415, partial [Myxococcota bacterium]
EQVGRPIGIDRSRAALFFGGRFFVGAFFLRDGGLGRSGLGCDRLGRFRRYGLDSFRCRRRFRLRRWLLMDRR